MFELIERSANKALQLGFGMNARTAALVTSSLNPISFSGLKAWALTALKHHYLPEFVENYTYDVTGLKGYDKKALRGRKAKGYDEALDKLATYSVLNVALDETSKAMNNIIADELAAPMAEKIRKEVLEAKDMEVNFFLQDVVMHGKESEAYLLQDCLSRHSKLIINNLLDITIGLAINATKFYAQCNTVLAASKSIAPHLITPLNTPNKILVSLLALSVARLTVTYLVKRIALYVKESTKESDNKFKTLVDYASKNAPSIISSGTSARLIASMQESYRGAHNNISHILSGLNKTITPIFKILEEWFLPRFMGKGILANPELEYKMDYYPVFKEFARMRKVITSMSDAVQKYAELHKSIEKINKLMVLLEQAEEKQKKAEEHHMMKITNEGEAVSDILLKLEKNTKLKISTQSGFTLTTELELKARDIMLLKGKSGSGKSSLTSAIAFAAFIEEGKVTRSDSFYKSMQDYSPAPNFTLLEDIMGKKEVNGDEKERVIKYLDELGMSKIYESDSPLDSPPSSKLSGGQKKAILLVSALMRGKKLIVLDEPFTGLDSSVIPKAIKLIKDHSEDRAFVIIDHVQSGLPFRDLGDGTNLYNKVCDITRGPMEARVKNCLEILKDDPTGEIQAAMRDMRLNIDLKSTESLEEALTTEIEKYKVEPGDDQVEKFLEVLTERLIAISEGTEKKQEISPELTPLAKYRSISWMAQVENAPKRAMDALSL